MNEKSEPKDKAQARYRAKVLTVNFTLNIEQTAAALEVIGDKTAINRAAKDYILGLIEQRKEQGG